MFLIKANLLHESLSKPEDITDNMNNYIKWYEKRKIRKKNNNIASDNQVFQKL
jgi:hypothetical protein